MQEFLVQDSKYFPLEFYFRFLPYFQILLDSLGIPEMICFSPLSTYEIYLTIFRSDDCTDLGFHRGSLDQLLSIQNLVSVIQEAYFDPHSSDKFKM